MTTDKRQIYYNWDNMDKKMKRITYLLLILISSILLVPIVSISSSPDISYTQISNTPSYRDYNITFSYINESQEQDFLSYLNEIDSSYFKNVKDIYVSTSEDMVYTYCNLSKLDNEVLNGCATSFGNIVVLYQTGWDNDLYGLIAASKTKRYLCHELIHNYLWNLSEEDVQSLEYSCYNKTKDV